MGKNKNRSSLEGHEVEDLRRRIAELEVSAAEHRATEEALRESEERYRSLVTQSSDGVYIFSPQTAGILEANPQFLRMVSYTEQEIADLTLYDLVAMPAEEIRINIRRVLEGGLYLSGLRRYRRKDGSLMDVEISSSLISYGKERVVMVNVRDVTERRKTEEELQAQAAKLREQAELLDITDDAILVRDLEDRIIFWNRGAEARYGWPAAEAMGKTSYVLLETVFPLPLPRIKEELFKKGYWAGELIHTNASGRTLVVESHWAVRFDKSGRPQAIMEINNDITERKAAQEELEKAKEELEVRVARRTAELLDTNERLLLELNRRKRIEDMLRKGAERYRNLFQNSPIGIYRTTPEGRILMANPTLLRMLGYGSFDELSATRSKKGGHEPTYLKKRFLSRLQKEGRVRGFEASWTRTDRTKIFVRENARAVPGPDGTIQFYEGTVEDISERRKAEERVEAYQKQLRSLASDLSLAEERERRRIANILHDQIGQILAVTRIKLGALLDCAVNTVMGEQLKEVRGFVEQAIKQTRSLTFELSPPVLYELGLEAALEWLGEQIEQQHHIECQFEADPHPKPVNDEVRVFLFTAVRELLVNVAKHAKAQKAKVTVRRLNDHMSIHVADDGSGFNAARMTFYLDENKGFGLFSIRERLHHLGGQMEIKSQRGRGTRVVLLAPLRTRAEEGGL